MKKMPGSLLKVALHGQMQSNEKAGQDPAGLNSVYWTRLAYEVYWTRLGVYRVRLGSYRVRLEGCIRGIGEVVLVYSLRMRIILTSTNVL
jgi:hypothetical protein